MWDIFGQWIKYDQTVLCGRNESENGVVMFPRYRSSLRSTRKKPVINTDPGSNEEDTVDDEDVEFSGEWNLTRAT